MSLVFQTFDHEFGAGSPSNSYSGHYDFNAKVRGATVVLNGWDMTTNGEYTTYKSEVRVVTLAPYNNTVNYEIHFAFTDESGNYAGAKIFGTIIADLED